MKYKKAIKHVNFSKTGGRTIDCKDIDANVAFKRLTKKMKEDRFFDDFKTHDFFTSFSEKQRSDLNRAKNREYRRNEKLGALVYKSTRNKNNTGKKTTKTDVK